VETVPEMQDVPEVSKDKFFEISDNLRDTFTNKGSGAMSGNKGGGFSLLAAFGRATEEDMEEKGHDFDGETRSTSQYQHC